MEKTVLENHRKEWQKQNNCVIAKTLWSGIENEKTKQLLKLEKNSIRVTTGVIRGNCAVRINLVKWKTTADSFFCRECNAEEETIEHLLCHCHGLEG